MSQTGGEAILFKAIISLLLCSIVSTFDFAPRKISIAPTRRGRITHVMAASESMLRSTTCLTSSAAQVAIDAACRVASANEWSVTVAVSDAGGVPLLVRRCDDAFPASYEIAVGKARTAALFRKPTGVLEDSANVSGGSSRAALLSAPFVLMRGGVPIFVDGACVGAVGVSGAKPGDDELVATAAVNALASITSKM
jgi:glc operon protein GlcG